MKNYYSIIVSVFLATATCAYAQGNLTPPQEANAEANHLNIPADAVMTAQQVEQKLNDMKPETTIWLAASQVAQAAYGSGFHGGSLVNSIAVAYEESNFGLDAECDNCVTGYTEDSCGLWQINIDVHPSYNKQQLLSSASYNAAAAYAISSSGTTWTPWSTFNNGKFISYLTNARNAAEAIDTTVIRGDNDTVSATTGLMVHPSAGSASSTRAVNAGTTGTVIDGPTVSVIGTGTYYYVWWKIHWNDGGADGWSVEDYMIRTGTSQPTVAITFATSPAGLQATVDGTTYTTPATFNWVPSSQHTLSIPTPQYSGLYSRYVFNGAQNQTITTPSSSYTFTANLSTQYDLTMAAGTGGSVSPSGGWYDSGSVVAIGATPNSGYSFSSWAGSGTGSYSGIVNSTSVTMNAPIFETANFAATPTISVTVQPSVSGRSFTVDGTAYTTTQTFSWVPGNSHTIATTSPQSSGTGIQYVWSNWSDGGAISHTVAPTMATTYTANFTTQYYLITGYGTGGSGVSPSGGWYNSGASVGLGETPASGYSFSSWTGSGTGSYSGSFASPTITMNGPISEMANFAQMNISVTVQPGTSGRSFTVDGTAYTTAQTFSWVPGNSHTIATTSPQSGGTGIQYLWSSWSDGGAMSHTVAPTVATTYTANFTTQYLLTTGYGTGGSGVSPSGGWYNSGASVGLSAMAASGYSFSSWTGSGTGSYSGSVASPTITMNGPISEMANFAQVNISVTVQPGTSGRSFTVDGTAYTTAQTFSWVPGNSHTIATTSPQSGGTGIQYVWSSWSDGGAMSHTVAPTVATTYTANFTTQYLLTTGYGNGGSGVTPNSGWYNSGANVALGATAASGYSFSNWTGSDTGSYSGSVASPTITMNGPISEMANFTAITPPSFSSSHISGGALQTTLSGLSTGETVILQTSTDLKNWMTDQTKVASGSTLIFTNTINPAMKVQYFRVMVQ